jgi:hypothetical protein
MNLIFLIDQSGSMEYNGKNLMLPVRLGIKEAITGNLQVNDEIVLIGGNDSPNIIYHKRIINQNDIQEILNKIDSIRAIKDCATDMTSWMEFVSKEVEPIFQSDDVLDREKTILYIITDGQNLPQPNSKYSTKDNSFHPAMKGFVSDILFKKWQINVIGVGFKTDAKSLSDSLNAAVYEISDSNTKDELRKIISQALKNNIQISNSTVEYLFRRGASNEIILNVTGGWDYGELDIAEAYITFPASTKNRIPMSYTEGKLGLTPSGTKKISLNFNLPIDNNIDGLHDGSIELVFKDGTTAEPKQFWIKARTEHWFIKHKPLVAIIILTILIILCIFFWYLMTPIYVVIKVNGEVIEFNDRVEYEFKNNDRNSSSIISSFLSIFGIGNKGNKKSIGIEIGIKKFTNGDPTLHINHKYGFSGSFIVKKKYQGLIVTDVNFTDKVKVNKDEKSPKEIIGTNLYNKKLTAEDSIIEFKSVSGSKYEREANKLAKEKYELE